MIKFLVLLITQSALSVFKESFNLLKNVETFLEANDMSPVPSYPNFIHQVVSRLKVDLSHLAKLAEIRKDASLLDDPEDKYFDHCVQMVEKWVEEDSGFLLCRICEKEINYSSFKKHIYVCQTSHELMQTILKNREHMADLFFEVFKYKKRYEFKVQFDTNALSRIKAKMARKSKKKFSEPPRPQNAKKSKFYSSKVSQRDDDELSHPKEDLSSPEMLKKTSVSEEGKAAEVQLEAVLENKGEPDQINEVEVHVKPTITLRRSPNKSQLRSRRRESFEVSYAQNLYNRLSPDSFENNFSSEERGTNENSFLSRDLSRYSRENCINTPGKSCSSSSESKQSFQSKISWGKLNFQEIKTNYSGSGGSSPGRFQKTKKTEKELLKNIDLRKEALKVIDLFMGYQHSFLAIPASHYLFSLLKSHQKECQETLETVKTKFSSKHWRKGSNLVRILEILSEKLEEKVANLVKYNRNLKELCDLSRKSVKLGLRLSYGGIFETFAPSTKRKDLIRSCSLKGIESSENVQRSMNFTSFKTDSSQFQGEEENSLILDNLSVRDENYSELVLEEVSEEPEGSASSSSEDEFILKLQTPRQKLALTPKPPKSKKLIHKGTMSRAMQLQEQDISQKLKAGKMAKVAIGESAQLSGYHPGSLLSLTKLDSYKERIPDQLPKLKKSFSDSDRWGDFANKFQGKTMAQKEIGINDFEFLKMIGKGGYGRVWLVRKKTTKELYAMKIINYTEKNNRNNMKDIKKEGELFLKLQGKFVLKAVFIFTHQVYICFVMDYLVMDLGSMLEIFGRFDEKLAGFYLAETVLALESMHSLGIIHRDIKPENILVDTEGHIKLTDFGLSEEALKNRMGLSFFEDSRKATYQKVKNNLNGSAEDIRKPLLMRSTSSVRNSVPADNIDEGSNSYRSNKSKLRMSASFPIEGNRKLIGTPDYIAVEVINGEGYSLPSIDIWALGVMMFEFLVGIPPFNDDSIEKIFENIKKRAIPWDQIEIGSGEDCISPEAYDLINKLLEPDLSKRLKIPEIKQHKFFKQIDWEKIHSSPAEITPSQIRNDPSEPSLQAIGKSTVFGNPFDQTNTLQPLDLEVYRLSPLLSLKHLKWDLNKETGSHGRSRLQHQVMHEI